MLKKFMTLALIALLNLAFYSTAAADTDWDARLAEKIKAEIARFGADNVVKIAVKLKDGTKLKGYISVIKDSGLIFRNEETGTESEIPYSQIRQVKPYKGSRSSVAVITLKVVLIFGLLGILGGGLSGDF